MGSRFDSDACSIDYTPNAAVVVGQLFALGANLVGIATRPIAANEKGSLTIEGAFWVTKDTGAGTDYAVGTKVYLALSGQKVAATDNSGANSRLGVVLLQPATTDTEVLVKINRG